MRVHPSKVPPPIKPREGERRSVRDAVTDPGPWAIGAVAFAGVALAVGLLSREDPHVARYDRWAAFRGCIEVPGSMSPDEAMARNTRCVQLADALLASMRGASDADAPAVLVATLRHARASFEAQMPLGDVDRARLVALGNALARRAWSR